MQERELFFAVQTAVILLTQTIYIDDRDQWRNRISIRIQFSSRHRR